MRDEDLRFAYGVVTFLTSNVFFFVATLILAALNAPATLVAINILWTVYAGIGTFCVFVIAFARWRRFWQEPPVAH